MKYTRTGKRIAMAVAAISLLISGILIFSSCSSSASTTTAAASQKTTVKKGSISNSITATGNLSMPNQAKLTFGSSGTVDQILVSLGDSVKKGQVLAKLDTVTVSTLKQALLQSQISVKQAQMNLDNAKTPTLSSSGSTVTAPDPLNVETKELALQSAQLNLASAQTQLDGSTLFAPFDGLVATINVLVGDKVSASTVAIRLIDPTQLQVDTLVNEMDIFNVKLGGPATIQVSALTDVTLPATVFAISPSATSSGGVVNYTVQLRVSSSQIARTALSGNNTANSGQFPAGVSGNVTGGAPRSLPQSSSSSGSGTGQFTPPSGSGQRTSTSGTTSTATIPSTLKEGLSVSITITIQQKTDVLMVASRALSKSGKTTTVNVVKSDGTTEQRQVTIGISDWQNTEITTGLTEGETVQIASTSSSTTSTTQRQQSTLGGLGGITGGPR